MKNIQKIKLLLQKFTYLAVAAELVFAILIASLSFGGTAMAGQLTARSITMADSGPSGGTISTGVGSGTNVAYSFKFTPSTLLTNIATIIIDFCSNSALIGDTCTAPTGFATNSGTLAVTNQSGLGAAALSVVTSGGNVVSTTNRVVLTKTAQLPTGPATFDLGVAGGTGFTNPSGAAGTFYARMLTYSGTVANTYSSTSINPSANNIDSGGIALSTVTVITITARVQETLLFCVFGGAAPNANCVAAGGSVAPALTIGHGTTKYIDATAIDSTPAYMQVSTNAATGATVRMHTSTAIGGLENGSSTIPPANAGGATSTAQTAGVAFFGLFVSAGSGGTGTLTADTNYNDGNALHTAAQNYYAMDTTSTPSAITTYGDPIAASAAPLASVNSTLTFGASASGVTPAGVYTANISLIATGTF